MKLNQPRIPLSCPLGVRMIYTVTEGDSLVSIASKFSLSLSTLVAANPHIADLDVLLLGDMLCIPGPIASNCKPSFKRYSVVFGDTISNIAKKFNIQPEDLITNNPYISGQTLIHPGDVLCVPIQNKLPCCIILNPQLPVPKGTGGAAYLHEGFLGTLSVSILATLPACTEFGNYDTFVGEVHIPNIGGFGAQIFPTPMDPTTFASTLNLPATAQLTPDSTILVRPARTDKGTSGPVILEGMFINSN